MPRPFSLRSAIAALTMAVAALCGGGKAVAEQRGTLSVVEIRAGAALRSGARKRAGDFLRNWLGVREAGAVVRLRDDETLAVWTPDGIEEALATLPEPAELGFHAVLSSPYQPPYAPPADALILPHREDGAEFALDPSSVIGRDDLASVEAQAENYSGRPALSLTLKEDAAQRFADLTRDSVGKAVAIVLDGEIASAPIVREPILGGQIMVTGDFTLREIQELAARLSAPTEGLDFVILRTCTAARPRAPPSWAPKWLTAVPTCDE